MIFNIPTRPSHVPLQSIHEHYSSTQSHLSEQEEGGAAFCLVTVTFPDLESGLISATPVTYVSTSLTNSYGRPNQELSPASKHNAALPSSFSLCFLIDIPFWKSLYSLKPREYCPNRSNNIDGYDLTAKGHEMIELGGPLEVLKKSTHIMCLTEYLNERRRVYRNEYFVEF